MKKSGGRYTRYKVSYSWEGDCEMGENKMPHIQLPENLGIRYAVLPGDPARAERAAGYLKDAKLLTFNREYKSYSGFWKDVYKRQIYILSAICLHIQCAGGSVGVRRLFFRGKRSCNSE